MTEARGSYHHGNLRAVLLENAERVLEESGPDELSLRQLAREAGVSHGAPRQHFADKRALLDALAERGFDQLGHELEAARVPEGAPFAAGLLAFARAWVGFATRRPALLHLMFAAKNREDARDLQAVADRTFAATSAMIAGAQADGEVVAGEHVAFAIFATLQGLASLVTSGMSGTRPVGQLVDETIATLVDGLRPR
ncbi:TetR/AcrR family transcriptional regulator [Amycolatopsis rhabdoformis]|uniref:TetR/AcrR family transcriptional regulator n=1 Tax=Amycolatopsis rhabdoformis TaxID=1448059 RepID=A0ABZ1HU21_9PSEU|nr:TetR/AcrR family transcriptional regulator [Amycolatopsis rhabdoformis]WSE25927.1 TetR/AcrR family transcriptional regulator [Amycolatopsis rhabdoformis]